MPADYMKDKGKQEIICIGCPLGCRGIVSVSQRDEILATEGYQCKEGKKYAKTEVKSPVRTLTATVIAVGGDKRLLPVRTNRPILKSKHRDCMKELAKVKVKPPVAKGEVIISNVLYIGADVIATADLSLKKQKNSGVLS